MQPAGALRGPLSSTLLSLHTPQLSSEFKSSILYIRDHINIFIVRITNSELVLFTTIKVFNGNVYINEEHDWLLIAHVFMINVNWVFYLWIKLPIVVYDIGLNEHLGPLSTRHDWASYIA